MSDETNETAKRRRVRHEALLTQALRESSREDLARRERIKDRFAERLTQTGEIEIVSSVEFVVGGIGPVGATYMVQPGPQMIERAREYARTHGLDEDERTEKLQAMIELQMSVLNQSDSVN